MIVKPLSVCLSVRSFVVLTGSLSFRTIIGDGISKSELEMSLRLLISYDFETILGDGKRRGRKSPEFNKYFNFF